MSTFERLRSDNHESIRLPGSSSLCTLVGAADLGVVTSSSDSPGPFRSEVSKLERDGRGRIRKKTCVRSDGRVTVEQDDPEGNLCELDIVDKTSSTVIKRTADPFSILFVGQRIDRASHVVDDVILARNFLVRLDHRSKSILSAERVDFKYNDPTSTPDYVDGRLDADRGSFQFRAKNGYYYKEFMAPGRWDLIDGETDIFISPFKGESASTSAQSAFVKHSDGSSIKVEANGAVSITNRSGQVTHESLTAEELNYLTAHPKTDKRDIAAIHERLHNTKALTDFYAQVTKFDSTKIVPRDQASAIEDNLLHQVAYPEEIYQGSMGSCNVTTIQRELALDKPALLAQEVYSVAELGKIVDCQGRVYRQDRAQLLKRDLSGRDVASRIFQSAAIDVLEQRSGRHFKNTIDGVGRVVNLVGGLSKFDGLCLTQIAEIGYLLEGETHSAVSVKSADEIRQAMRYQCDRAVVAEVDASMPPFTAATTGIKRAGHVVSVTCVQTSESGTDALAYENQWGLAFDHSKAQAMVNADSFFRSMSVESAPDGSRRNRAYGLLLMRGLTQNVRYEFVAGRLQPLKQFVHNRIKEPSR